MKITVKLNDIVIVIDESDNEVHQQKTTVKHLEQSERVISIVRDLTELCIKMKNQPF